MFILALLAVGSVQGAASGDIIYVRHDATGNNDGSSWADAYTDVQDALGTAQAGDEIWVAQGVYYPAPNAIDRTATFELVDGVGLYGGFAGTEAERHQRDWNANVTVLSGDLDRNDITDENGVVTDTDNIVGRNAYHVVMADGVGDTTTLDGFVVTAGLADGTYEQRNGGGMYIQLGDASLANVTFSGNQAVWGGGMYNLSGNSTLTNVSFSSNQAGDGGGMYNESARPTLTDVTFTTNGAEWDGGGMYNGSGSPILTTVTFADNSAQRYGGGFFHSGGSPTLTWVTFEGNSANWGGGGMHNHGPWTHPRLTNVVFSNNSASSGGGMSNYDCDVTLIDVTFYANHAVGGGGGISWLSGDSTLTNVTFSDNEASRGGGIYDTGSATLTWVTFDGNRARESGGGMFNRYGSPTLTNVSLRCNQANEYGGAMFNYNSSPSLTNVTFSGNVADYGAGLYNEGGDATFKNITMSGNKAESMGGAIYNEDSSPVLANSVLWGNAAPIGPQMHNEGTSSPYVLYSDIEGGYPGEGNIDADPLFVDPVDANQAPTTHGDYRLTEGSPAIDAGTNDVITVDTDLDGNPRIVDGTGDGNAIVDMGAYEFQASFGRVYLPLVLANQ